MVCIVDYGMGNLKSVHKKASRITSDVSITRDPDLIARADKLILPGVGHFGMALSNINTMNLWEPLQQAVLIDKKPILGICLGMQLMGGFGTEGETQGLGWFDATIDKFEVSDPKQFKIPHVGWNLLEAAKDSLLLKGLDLRLPFYFVHSFYFKCHNEQDVLGTSKYDLTFHSAIEKDHIFGVQFHPEKSHQQGEELFKNFINL